MTQNQAKLQESNTDKCKCVDTVIAYRKYQLDWLSDHGYCIEDIYNLADQWHIEKNNHEFDGSFGEYIEEYGFGGDIWACYDEFIECEYSDKVV